MHYLNVVTVWCNISNMYSNVQRCSHKVQYNWKLNRIKGVCCSIWIYSLRFSLHVRKSLCFLLVAVVNMVKYVFFLLFFFYSFQLFSYKWTRFLKYLFICNFFWMIFFLRFVVRSQSQFSSYVFYHFFFDFHRNDKQFEEKKKNRKSVNWKM